MKRDKETARSTMHRIPTIAVVVALSAAFMTGTVFAADAGWEEAAYKKMAVLEQRIQALYEARMEENPSSYPNRQQYTIQDFRGWLDTLEKEADSLLQHFNYLMGGPYCTDVQYPNRPERPNVSQQIYDPITDVRSDCDPYTCDPAAKRCRNSCRTSMDCIPFWVCTNENLCVRGY